MLDSKPHSPRYYSVVIPTLALLIAAVVGLSAYVYAQSRTQHQICQAFEFFGTRTQQQIDLSSRNLKIDLGRHDRAKVAVDRKSISDATSFLIRIKRVQC